MDRVEDAVSSSSCIVGLGLVAVGTCLFRGRYLVTGLHATIFSLSIVLYFILLTSVYYFLSLTPLRAGIAQSV
jgi:uncharacterized membrane protein (GlpM family)